MTQFAPSSEGAQNGAHLQPLPHSHSMPDHPSIEEIAARLNCNIKDGQNWRGPDPRTGEGTDRFCLYPEGNATLRNGTKFRRDEVLKLAGYNPEYRPQAALAVPSSKSVKTLEERGLTADTLRFFKVLRVEGSGTNRNGWKYPTYHTDGSEGRIRFKNARPKSKTEKKYLWWKGGDNNEPDGYNLQNVPDGAPLVDIVGGEPDVWMMHQNGFLAVAPFGETQGQEKLVAAFKAKGIGVARITLDADGAGDCGAAKFARECEAQGQSFVLRRFTGAEGHDVCDEFSRVGYDRAKFRTALEALPEISVSDLESESPKAQKSAPYRPKISTAAELMAKEIPPAKFIAPGIIAEGLTIFAGHPKLGKSWLMLNLGIAVAFGGAWLGSIPIEKGDVLYLALEDNERRMKTRLAKCLNGAPAPQNFHYATEWRRIDEGGLEDLEYWLQAHPAARLIVVDTLQKVKPRRRISGNSYENDSDDVGALKALADKYGVAIICVHHRRKGQDGDDLEAVSGSYGLTGAADGIMSLKRDRTQSDAVLTATGRDLEENKELALKFDSVLGTWALMGDAEEYRVSGERGAIVNAIRDAGKPLTPKEIAEATGKSSGSIRFLLTKMVLEGQVEGLGSGLYKVPENARFLPSTANIPNTANSINSTNTAPNTANRESMNCSLTGGYPRSEGRSQEPTQEPAAPSDSAVSDISAVRGVSAVSAQVQNTNQRREDEEGIDGDIEPTSPDDTTEVMVF